METAAKNSSTSTSNQQMGKLLRLDRTAELRGLTGGRPAGGDCREAQRVIEDALAEHWDAALVLADHDWHQRARLREYALVADHVWSKMAKTFLLWDIRSRIPQKLAGISILALPKPQNSIRSCFSCDQAEGRYETEILDETRGYERILTLAVQPSCAWLPNNEVMMLLNRMPQIGGANEVEEEGGRDDSVLWWKVILGSLRFQVHQMCRWGSP